MQEYDFASGGILGGLASGVSFSLPLIVILGSHELAHYLNSRRHGVKATLPYFIPFPNIFGTMGAVIKIKSPIFDRRALIDIGASGPIVGFVFAVIATSIGLYLSVPAEEALDGANEIIFGPSLLFTILGNIFRPDWGDSGTLILHPIAMAGWVGFFVTSINLMPVGQLDGGHIAYAFFGRHHKTISKVFIAILFVMGYELFIGWLVWAVLLLAIGLRHPPVYDEQAGIDIGRVAIGVVSLAIFVLTFMPIPVNTGGLKHYISLF